MKKLLSKDENQVRYLLENGLTEVTYFKTKNDKPFISFGLMGGAMQPQGHAQIIVNLVSK